MSKVAKMEGTAQDAVLTNQTVKGQSLSENENQDHSHEQLGLLSVGPAYAKHSSGGERNISTCMVLSQYACRAMMQPSSARMIIPRLSSRLHPLDTSCSCPVPP